MSNYYDRWSKLTREQQSRVFELENDNNFDRLEEIACPYCDYVQYGIEGPDVGYEQDEETEFTCQYSDCGKDFTVIAHVSYSWSTQVPQEEALEMLEAEL